MIFTNTFIPAANLVDSYEHQLTVSGSTGTVTFTLIEGATPPGIVLTSDGVLRGTATIFGSYSFTVKAVDSANETAVSPFYLSVMDLVDLSSMSVDPQDFVEQLSSALVTKSSWATGITSQTSQTLIELIAAVGTYLTARAIRIKEDAFSETAVSDSAQRAIAITQGLRLTRKGPATIQVLLQATANLIIDPYTQFVAGGLSWFNTDAIELDLDAQGHPIPNLVTLKQGLVKKVNIAGLGTPNQGWVSQEDQFVVSDQDVTVSVNGNLIYKCFGLLWNYAQTEAVADRTLSDGRLALQFGANGFGTVPTTNDVVTVTYAVTNGSASNSLALVGAAVSASGFPVLTGEVFTNPSGGSDERPAVAYKNFSAGSFGTFSSGVTGAQYDALVKAYPGIVDSVVVAQRQLNPSNVRWMNVMRVAALTNSEWDNQRIHEFLDWLSKETMYSTQFQWLPPIPVPRDIKIKISCFNAVTSLSAVQATATKAVLALFSARPGLLGLDLYESDIVETIMNACPGQVSYVTVEDQYGGSYTVNSAKPKVSSTVTTSGGVLLPGSYSYGIGTVSNIYNEWNVADETPPSSWTFPVVTQVGSKVVLTWTAVPNVSSYVIWGRSAGQTARLGYVDATDDLTYVDDGSGVSIPDMFPTDNSIIRYNVLNSLVVNAVYASRQVVATLPVRDVLGGTK